MFSEADLAEFTQACSCSRQGAVTHTLPFCHLQIQFPRPMLKKYPESPKHIGEHIKKKRLDLGLLQHEAAEEMGVSLWTVINWELGETTPPVWYGPRIIKFLGYDATPEPQNFVGRIWSLRWRLGLKQSELAEELGVSASTVSDWERSRCRPSRKIRQHVHHLRTRLASERAQSQDGAQDV